MCLAIPGKIIKINGRKAVIQYPNETRPATIGEEGIKIGDYVMVQMGIVIKKMTKAEAEISTRAWNQL